MLSRFGAVKSLVACAEVQQYSQIMIKGGDRIWAASMCPYSEGHRDMTYVWVGNKFTCIKIIRIDLSLQYKALINLNANSTHTAPAYKLMTFYGHLWHLFAVHLPQELEIGLEHPTTVLLAGITECKIDAGHETLDIHYYFKESKTESIINLSCVQCLIGHMQYAENRWAIIDRSGSLSHALWVPN